MYCIILYDSYIRYVTSGEAKPNYFLRRSQCVKTNISFLFFIEITRRRGFFKTHPPPSLPLPMRTLFYCMIYEYFRYVISIQKLLYMIQYILYDTNNYTIRTYVELVKNICHVELANPLTKRTLLVIG